MLNNLRTFVEFLDQSIYALFRPADFCPRPAPPRPAGKSSAPHIPDVYDEVWVEMMIIIKHDNDDKDEDEAVNNKSGVNIVSWSQHELVFGERAKQASS